MKQDKKGCGAYASLEPLYTGDPCPECHAILPAHGPKRPGARDARSVFQAEAGSPPLCYFSRRPVLPARPS